MTESELYQKILRKEFQKIGLFFFRIDYQSIPDVYLSKNGCVLWAELKCVNKSSPIVRPQWRPGQLAWIKEHEAFNKDGVCLILYYVGDVYWLRPKQYYKEEELECLKSMYLNNLTKLK